MKFLWKCSLKNDLVFPHYPVNMCDLFSISDEKCILWNEQCHLAVEKDMA